MGWGLVNVGQVNPNKFDPAGSAAEVQKNLDYHTNDKRNPHGVTAEQVGADPAGSAAAVQGNLTVHINNKQNPHGVTAEQVGAFTKEEVITKMPSTFQKLITGRLI